MELSETEVQKQIIEWLKRIGWFCWRQNSGAMKGKYQVGKKGCPDIIGVTPWGQFFAFEVKRAKEKPSDHQLKFMAELRENHAAVSWGCTLESCQKFVRSLRRECEDDGK